MSDLKQSLLKVAQSNPDFAKALTAELHKTGGDDWDKARQRMGYFGWAASRLAKLKRPSHDWEFPYHAFAGWPETWDETVKQARKVQEAVAVAMEGIEMGEVILKRRSALGAKRKKYLQTVIDEMVRSAPAGVSGAKRVQKDEWNPYFHWNGPSGPASVYLDFDSSTSPFYEHLNTKTIEVDPNTGKTKFFRVRNSGIKGVAESIWAGLTQQGAA